MSISEFLKGMIAATLLACAGLIPASSQDSDNPVVIELFTSQGCPGCPPADALLKRMASREGILTLSWPIDYWDRLGWEDTLASPDNAVRQTAYNKRLGVAGVFTPEMIISGNNWCKGNDQATLESKIAQAQAAADSGVRAALVVDGGQINATVNRPGAGQSLFVRLVWFKRDVTVNISGGVNEGRTLHYTNVVRGSEVLDEMLDAASGNWSLELAEGNSVDADGVALLVHADYGHGPVVAATAISLD